MILKKQRHLRNFGSVILIAALTASVPSCGDSPSGTSIGSSGPDPLYSQQWYLKNTGQSAYSSASAVSGNDLGIGTTFEQGYTGNGVHILLSDDGLDYTHEDLAANYDSTRSRDYRVGAPFTGAGQHHSTMDGHGTAVAGIMTAINNNAKGIRGIASKATIASANLISSGVTVTTSRLIDQAATSADIVNQSWGTSQSSINNIIDSYLVQMQASTSTGRSNKGIVFVQSGGNDYHINLGSGVYRAGNSNFDGNKATPYSIVVSALDTDDAATARSSCGANLWLSAYGGGNGMTSPAIVTTDRSGCSLGLSTSIAIENTFENGTLSANSQCNYTSTMNGSSSSAPMVSAAVALMLEANPNLTWRDVKHILASTANQVDAAIGDIENPDAASPPSHIWEQGWITNAAGFKFHNRYGFGKLNIDAAVTMAKTYVTALGTWSDSGEISSGSISLSIPDHDAGGVSNTIPVSSSLTIESIRIKASATHADAGQIGLEITSPSGPKSIIKNVNDALYDLVNLDQAVFVSNAFYGESANGNWIIKTIDGTSGITGTLDQWSITVYGH